MSLKIFSKISKKNSKKLKMLLIIRKLPIYPYNKFLIYSKKILKKCRFFLMELLKKLEFSNRNTNSLLLRSLKNSLKKNSHKNLSLKMMSQLKNKLRLHKILKNKLRPLKILKKFPKKLNLTMTIN